MAQGEEQILVTAEALNEFKVQSFNILGKMLDETTVKMLLVLAVRCLPELTREPAPTPVNQQHELPVEMMAELGQHLDRAYAYDGSGDQDATKVYEKVVELQTRAGLTSELEQQELQALRLNARQQRPCSPHCSGHLRELAIRSAGRPDLAIIRHLKRGTDYLVVGKAKGQVSEGARRGLKMRKSRVVFDDTEVVVYRSVETGELYFRFEDEVVDTQRFLLVREAGVGL